MSKAYIGVKNFNLTEMRSIWLYGTKYPERLTERQKLTRLYRVNLRCSYAHHMSSPGFIFKDFMNSMSDLRYHFEKLMKLESTSAEYKGLIDKFEKRAHKYYEPTGIVRKQDE